MRNIPIENYDLAHLERAYYDYNAYLNLLSYALQTPIPIDEQNFHKIFTEFQNVNKIYEQEKRNFQINFVDKNLQEGETRWEVNFLTKTLQIS